MKIKFCSFATKKFYSLQERQIEYLKETANLSFEYVKFNEKFVTNYLKNNKTDCRISAEKKGFGYWFWKPLIIKHVLDSSEEGSLIIYIDAGDIVNGQLINRIIEYDCKHNLSCILLSGFNRQGNWTHKNCFNKMNCKEQKYYDAIQLEAGFQIWKKNEENICIINDYCSWCQNYEVVCDQEISHEGYIEHRHDQSVLTNLKTKYSLLESSDIKEFSLRNYVECNVI